MFGYFGQAYFGGAAFDDDGGGGGGTPPGGTRLAADAASSTDWDTTTSGLGSDESAHATEATTTTGLGIGNSTKFATDGSTFPTTDVAVATGLGGGSTPPPPPPTQSRSVIRFVDSVSLNASVRLDLTATFWRVLFDGTSTPPPPMEDQRAASMLVDGEHIAASVYKNREVTLALLLETPTSPQGAVEIQKLQREMDRPTNVLWWQPDDTLPPVFFRTFRGPDVTSDLDWGIRTHHFSVVIEAEPFALGPRVDLPPVTVNFDPAAAFNACRFDLTGIVGDVDTPLYITTSDVDFAARAVAFATRRRGTPSTFPAFRQAEDTGLTLGVDAARVVSSGQSGGNAVRVNFASTLSNALRLSGSFPAAGTGNVDWRGTYRVLMRASGSPNIKVQVATGITPASRNPAVSFDTTNAFVLLDLGLVRLPVGNAGRAAGYGGEHPAGASTLYFYAETTTGSGSLNIDYIFLVPADETYALVQFPDLTPGMTVVVDGPNGEVYPLNAAGEMTAPSIFAPYVDGTLPTVSPMADTNRVFVLNGIGFVLSTVQANSAILNVAYWPKYRLVRPVLT